MLRWVINRWRGLAPTPQPAPKASEPPIPQAGAVPYRVTDKGLSLLLVTSRRTGRWVFPKGGLMSGRTPWASAAREALEEAGVEGEVEDEPLGVYPAVRIRGERRQPLEVTLYLLRVTRQLDRWPERGQRRRQWTSLPEAIARLGDPGLVEVLEQATPRLEALAPPAKPGKGRGKGANKHQTKAASGRST